MSLTPMIEYSREYHFVDIQEKDEFTELIEKIEDLVASRQKTLNQLKVVLEQASLFAV